MPMEAEKHRPVASEGSFLDVVDTFSLSDG